MADPSVQQRLAAAANFILQAPPGEINDVLNDVRPLVGDDATLESGLLAAFSQYNLEQLTVVELPGSETPALICPHALVFGDDSRYYHPSSSLTFAFDHLHLTVSDHQPYSPREDDVEALRKELETETAKYVGNHYEGGAWGVYTVGEKVAGSSKLGEDVFVVEAVEVEAMTISTPAAEAVEDPVEEALDEPPSEPTPAEPAAEGKAEDAREAEVAEEKETESIVEEAAEPAEEAESSATDVEEILDEPLPKHFQLYFVGNKYNPANYWTGRWRSSYEVNLEEGTVTGRILVNVHYYEQGNVQLSTDFVPSITLRSGASTSPAQILKLIYQAESDYQTSLNTAYANLGDRAFRQLRRALPISKQKIDWTRALGGYKMSAELQK